ncbi:MAG: putative glutathione S-transferase [Rhodoferax sp.]|nr:putative glutathione S-transferase [Rhodoferax sp.]
MLLYGSTDSGHSYKIRSFLLLAGVPHTYRWVDLSHARTERPAAFVAASKFGEVPVLIDGGNSYCQSNAILMHLAQRTKAFRGIGSEWTSILEWLCWESNRIGFSLPNLRYALLWGRQPAEVLAYLRSRVVADLQSLDEVLAKSEFLLPSGPTIADLSCSAYLFWLSQVGIAEDEFPCLGRWLCSLRALPGWVHPGEAMKFEAPSTGG